MVPRSRKTDHLKLGMISIEVKIHFTHLFKIEWQTQCQVATGVERSILIPIPKKGSTKECSNHRTVALTSHANQVVLKILQARLQQYVNRQLPTVQAGFRKCIKEKSNHHFRTSPPFLAKGCSASLIVYSIVVSCQVINDLVCYCVYLEIKYG